MESPYTQLSSAPMISSLYLSSTHVWDLSCKSMPRRNASHLGCIHNSALRRVTQWQQDTEHIAPLHANDLGPILHNAAICIYSDLLIGSSWSWTSSSQADNGDSLSSFLLVSHAAQVTGAKWVKLLRLSPDLRTEEGWRRRRSAGVRRGGRCGGLQHQPGCCYCSQPM